MRPEVQVLAGPPPALTSENAGQRVRSWLGGTGAGSRTLTWLPLLVMDVLLRASAQARWVPPAARTAPSGPSTTCLVGLTRPTLAAQPTTGDWECHGRGCADRWAVGRRPHQTGPL